MKLGLKPGAMPKVRAGDIERAWELNIAANGDLKTRHYLKELVAAQAAADEASAQAQTTMAAATKRDQMAKQAEADATRARQLLADETAAARAELGQREVKVAERENLVAEAEKSQTARDADLKRRETHLASAGVRGF